jgi:hypothetical protein
LRADCQMAGPIPQPPSRAASSRDARATPITGHQDPVEHLGDNLSPIRSDRKGSGTLGTIFGTPGTVSGPPGSGTPRAEGTGNSEDEIAPSPNMRRVLTRLQRASEVGGSSARTVPTTTQRREQLRRSIALCS